MYIIADVHSVYDWEGVSCVDMRNVHIIIIIHLAHSSTVVREDLAIVIL